MHYPHCPESIPVLPFHMPLNESILRELIGKTRPVINKKAINPIVQSPLLTNFQRWSGKKRRLYLKHENEDIPRVHLSNNPFAQLLAAPLRYERLSRTRIPKSLVIQTRYDEKINTIKLCLVNRKSGNNAYLVTSERMLDKNVTSAASIIPMHLLGSGKLDLGKIKYDKSEMIREYRGNMIEDIICKLSQIAKQTVETFEKEPSPDVYIIYEAQREEKDARIMVKNSTNSRDHMAIAYFNLTKLNNSQLDKTINSTPQRRIPLTMARNQSLILNIYRLLQFVE